KAIGMVTTICTRSESHGQKARIQSANSTRNTMTRNMSIAPFSRRVESPVNWDCRRLSGRAVMFEPARAQEPDDVANYNKGDCSHCHSGHSFPERVENQRRHGTRNDAADRRAHCDKARLRNATDGEADDCARHRCKRDAAQEGRECHECPDSEEQGEGLAGGGVGLVAFGWIGHGFDLSARCWASFW